MRKADLSFNDVIAAQGRNEAGKIIRGRIGAIDEEIAAKRRQEEAETDTMNATLSRRRTAGNPGVFQGPPSQFADHLSVRIDTDKPLKGNPGMYALTTGRDTSTSHFVDLTSLR